MNAACPRGRESTDTRDVYTRRVELRIVFRSVEGFITMGTRRFKKLRIQDSQAIAWIAEFNPSV